MAITNNTSMKAQRLSRTFFNRPTLRVARDLLGKFLVRRIGRKIIVAMITETEAYCGPNDLASHASRGRTPRTEVMFGPPGHAYVYLIYGMYHCLNVVTERENYPAAVLIRGVSLQWPIDSEKPKPSTLKTVNCKLETYLAGPGKLCRSFQINRDLNKEDLTTSKNLWLEDREIKLRPDQIKHATRIGINYARQYKNKLWRFCLK